MLHDLFLYNWRKRQHGRKGLHGFTHPKTSLENSLELFSLSTKEEDIILKHMWPLTVTLPKYKESYIVCLADKICVLKETFEHYKKTSAYKRIYRYACILIAFCIFGWN